VIKSLIDAGLMIALFDKNDKLNSSYNSYYGYIFGSYSFSTNLVFLDSRIGLNLQKENNLNPDTYFIFNQDKGYFLIPLPPGKYEIVGISYFSGSTYEVYDSQLTKFSFDIKKESVSYLGSFVPNISFDVEYIYWGIVAITNNFEADKSFLN